MTISLMEADALVAMERERVSEKLRRQRRRLLKDDYIHDVDDDDDDVIVRD